MDSYTNALIKEIEKWGGGKDNSRRFVDTVYLGGGTPSLLKHRLPDVLNAVKRSFEVLPHSEITLELNPASNSEALLEYQANSTNFQHHFQRPNH